MSKKRLQAFTRAPKGGAPRKEAYKPQPPKRLTKGEDMFAYGDSNLRDLASSAAWMAVFGDVTVSASLSVLASMR